MSFAVTNPDAMRPDYGSPLEFQLQHDKNPTTPSSRRFDIDFTKQQESSYLWLWVVGFLLFVVIYGILYAFSDQISFSGVDGNSSLVDKIFIVFGWSLLVSVLLTFVFFPVFLAMSLIPFLAINRSK